MEHCMDALCKVLDDLSQVIPVYIIVIYADDEEDDMECVEQLEKVLRGRGHTISQVLFECGNDDNLYMITYWMERQERALRIDYNIVHQTLAPDGTSYEYTKPMTPLKDVIRIASDIEFPTKFVGECLQRVLG